MRLLPSGRSACVPAPAAPATATPALQHSLSVGKLGAGAGTVTSTPAGISCGSTCTAEFADGTMVTLTAAADVGSTFVSWTGACSGSGACTVSMTEARSVTARFSLDQFTSSVTNGVIKLGVDTTNMGGAITYLSEAASPTNLINIYDRGRAVQQSYYAGAAVDRSAEGQFFPNYSPWPWNPITAGDVYGNRGSVIDFQSTSTSMYVKTRPLLWDMPLDQCECVFETWMTLEGRSVRVHNKLTTTRTDNRWNVLSRDQELPAVYPTSSLPEVVSYTGDQPFTGEPTSAIPDDPASIWSAWNTPESWAACVNASGFGVGVYTPGRTRFIGGLYGSPGGGSRASSTCYLSPLEFVPLDKTSTFEYDYWLTVGTLDQIRQEAYELHQSIPSPPAGHPAGDSQVWNFDADGDFGGWTPANVAASSVNGGAFNATSTGVDPQMQSATLEKPAADDEVVVRLRNDTPSTTAQLFFTTVCGRRLERSEEQAHHDPAQQRLHHLHVRHVDRPRVDRHHLRAATRSGRGGRAPSRSTGSASGTSAAGALRLWSDFEFVGEVPPRAPARLSLAPRVGRKLGLLTGRAGRHAPERLPGNLGLHGPGRGPRRSRSPRTGAYSWGR